MQMRNLGDMFSAVESIDHRAGRSPGTREPPVRRQARSATRSGPMAAFNMGGPRGGFLPATSLHPAVLAPLAVESLEASCQGAYAVLGEVTLVAGLGYALTHPITTALVCSGSGPRSASGFLELQIRRGDWPRPSRQPSQGRRSMKKAARPHGPRQQPPNGEMHALHGPGVWPRGTARLEEPTARL